ncbi:MAG: GNAT family N-acetyltransferase, partial [Actinomycetota bacterium]|nr:GNAT family N-acetyltransferase [Actinomycetota bacterium]
AFERAQQMRAGAASTPHPLGRLARHAGHAGYWSLNELQVHHPAPPGLDAAAIVRAADEAQGDLPHRRVFVDDDATGARVAPALQAGGWRCTRDVYMVLRRSPDRPAAATAREAGVETMLSAKLALLEQTVDRHEGDVIAAGTRAMATAGTRFVVADWEGSPAAYATLYSDGATAQVEDVATQPRARGHGLARAVVQHAVDLARAREHETVFLVAEADDWPRELYARLGFDPVGHCWALIGPPSDQIRGASIRRPPA